MKIISSPEQMSMISKGLVSHGRTIGFVPTMGALHAGHISLIRQARRDNDKVVVSIFINPAQFGKNEDFSRYPRNLKKDAFVCRKAGADFIFHPGVRQIYPEGYRTYICVESLSDTLCGRSRPGHFRGVATIVAKLFNIVLPDSAYFGQKDAQQALIIKKMVMDLNMPVKVKVMPTVREKDGLALSSRNQYLNSRQRHQAAILYAALNLARALISRGNIDSGLVIRKMKKLIHAESSAEIDYAAIVNPEDLIPVKRIAGEVLIAVAVRIGKTRLIDNIIVNGKKQKT